MNNLLLTAIDRLNQKSSWTSIKTKLLADGYAEEEIAPYFGKSIKRLESERQANAYWTAFANVCVAESETVALSWDDYVKQCSSGCLDSNQADKMMSVSMERNGTALKFLVLQPPLIWPIFKAGVIQMFAPATSVLF